MLKFLGCASLSCHHISQNGCLKHAYPLLCWLVMIRLGLGTLFTVSGKRRACVVEQPPGPRRQLEIVKQA